MNYWKNAEQINGRLAMMGFFAAVINYGFTGWVIPGIRLPVVAYDAQRTRKPIIAALPFALKKICLLFIRIYLE